MGFCPVGFCPGFSEVTIIVFTSPFIYKVKVLILSKYCVDTRERGNSPGVVWCIIKFYY